MKAYKIFNPNWKCLNFQYELGKTYEIYTKPVICESGFHACQKLIDCFNYYPFDPQNKIAEVDILGDFVIENDKIVTNKIYISRELSWHKVLDLVNAGNRNTGYGNAGNWNAGYRNTGNRNAGDGNTGDGNTGNWNAGDWNAG